MIQRFDSAEVAGAKSPPPHCRTMDVMASDANPLGSYGQLCPVAAGTDAVADRWTLLLLRDLAHTPLRFTELQAANPRISPSVLTKRLLRLEEDGLIETITAERTAQKRYQIRDAVRTPILAVLDAVSKLGFALTPEGDVTAEQLVAQLETDRAWFLAKHHRTEGSFAMHIDDASIGLVVSQFSFEPSVTVPDRPTAIVTCSLETMLQINTTALTVKEAIKNGQMTVDGDRAAVEALFAALSAPYIGAA